MTHSLDYQRALDYVKRRELTENIIARGGIGCYQNKSREREEKKAVKESLQYEVIMTMEEEMGVRGGCAIEDKTVHDEKSEWDGPEHK